MVTLDRHFVPSREGNVRKVVLTWQAVAGFSILYQVTKTLIFHDGKRLIIESHCSLLTWLLRCPWQISWFDRVIAGLGSQLRLFCLLANFSCVNIVPLFGNFSNDISNW